MTPLARDDDTTLRDDRLEPAPEHVWRGPRLMVSLRADWVLCLTCERRGESFVAHLYAPLWRRTASRFGSIEVSPDEFAWLVQVRAEAEALADLADAEPLLDPRLRCLD